MNFDIDRQTISDLGLFGYRKDEKSIFSFYNRAETKGGQELLQRLMWIPVADIELLESRQAEINFFFSNDISIHLVPRNIEFIEYYLKVDRSPLKNNVKDAYDGSLSIISALARVKGSLFFISSHLLEVAENLGQRDSISFNCFESRLIDSKPVYDFKLRSGVSKERIGMLIIEKEHIMEMLDGIIAQQNSLH